MTHRGLFFFCLTISAAIAGPACRAQNGFSPEWTIGASTGAGLSSVGFAPKVQEDLLPGWHGGITIRRITEKNLGLQLEINFKQQGWKENFDDSELVDNSENLNYRYIRRMNYVEMPFLTHLYFGGNKTRIFVNLGPQIGFLLGESTDENLHGAKPQKVNEQHTMPAEIKFEWGVGGGPGVEIRTSAGFFLLEGRYYYALGDFYHTRRKDAFSKASSQVISLKLTYLIPRRSGK